MTNTMNHQAVNQDHVVLTSQLYPVVYTQITPQRGESKRIRRRKKNKNFDNGSAGAKKRKLSDEQVNMLELNFGNEQKLESDRKDRLAAELGLDPRQVSVWFQNRRARWKKKKLEEDYNNMKKVHETVVLEKCQLESEVVKLKEYLLEAEKKVQRLSEGVDDHGGSSNSPISSLTMETVLEPAPFSGEFWVEGLYNDVFYTPESINYIFGMEWPNLYM